MGLSITTMRVSGTKETKNMSHIDILSEYDLVSHLAEQLKGEFRTDAFAREFAVGYGIADLVFAKSFYSKKNRLNRKPINNYYALMLYLSLQPETEFTMADAAEKLRTNRLVAHNAATRLLEDGYISQVAKGSYTRANVIEPAPLKLVAIEAKLKDWKQGILQARRYKTFTDESYLAILAKYEKNIDPQMLAIHDIGLILVDHVTGTITFKRRPEGFRPKHMTEQVETEMYANELFLDSFRIKTA